MLKGNRTLKKALLIGESWTTHMIHQKGFDSFTTTEYVEGGKEYCAALEQGDWSVTHIPAHAIESQFPSSADALAEYDVVVISDVGVNTFLLSRAVFAHSHTEPNKLTLIRDYVFGGGGLLMVGGYLSFSGVDAKAHYANSPIGDILPVSVLETDDRAEHPEGAKVEVLASDHAAIGGVGTEWPSLLGYNRTIRRDDAELLATVNGDPLVAVMTVGEGRTGVFTSDMSPHWAPPPFIEWEGYGPLWRALTAWVARS
jgi:uncharacterized membrane protein